jgi:hypothetical protein
MPIIHTEEKHDEKTCFYCRLVSLMLELYPEGPDDLHKSFMLYSIAEAIQMIVTWEGKEESMH